MLSTEKIAINTGPQWQKIDYNDTNPVIDFSIQNVSEGVLIEYSFTQPPSGTAGVAYTGSLLPYCGVITNLTQDIYVRCKDPKRPANVIAVRNM